MNINRIIVAGNLVRDPELRTFADNKTIATFTLAVNKSYKTQSGDYKKEASFFKIVTWNSIAQLCMKNLKKGNQVVVEGELSIRNYQDSEGIKRYVTQIVGNQVSFFSQPRSENIYDSPALV